MDLATVGRAVTVLQDLDTPLRRYQQLPLQPAVGPERGGGEGVQVLGELPDDILWLVPPPASTSGAGARRRLLRGTGAKALLARLRGQDALALLDASPDAVFAVDPANRVVLFNEAAQRTFGYVGSEIVGHSGDLLVAPAARGVLALLRQQVLDGARPGPAGEAVEVAGMRRDGTGFPAAVWLARVETRHGPVVTAVFRDMSAHRESDTRARAILADLQHSQDVVNAILRAISDRLIVIADAEGRITTVNRAAERLLGYSAAELVGRPTLCLYDPDDIAVAAAELGLEPGTDPLLEITRSGLPNLQEWSYVAKSGQRCPVSLKIIAIGDRRDPSGFVCVAHDLTLGWQPIATASSERLLRELDDAPTRTLRWQVGGSGYARRR
ncbi:MAG TPA: PAS domain S-box protein [Kineosporiaceae bacterium]|nr:PAS domain S-box protein [Kineosporiaceae bacterium]